MNNPGVGVVERSVPGADATTTVPAKSIASPGEVGSRTGSPSHSVWSGVNGINHNPLVPKIVPAATKVASSGDQIAPWGKPLVASVNPLICNKPLPSGYTSHKFFPAFSPVSLPSAKTRSPPSGDHAGQDAPGTVERIRCRPLPSAVGHIQPGDTAVGIQIVKCDSAVHRIAHRRFVVAIRVDHGIQISVGVQIAETARIIHQQRDLIFLPIITDDFIQIHEHAAFGSRLQIAQPDIALVAEWISLAQKGEPAAIRRDAWARAGGDVSVAAAVEIDRPDCADIGGRAPAVKHRAVLRTK